MMQVAACRCHAGLYPVFSQELCSRMYRIAINSNGLYLYLQAMLYPCPQALYMALCYTPVQMLTHMYIPLVPDVWGGRVMVRVYLSPDPDPGS